MSSRENFKQLLHERICDNNGIPNWKKTGRWSVKDQIDKSDLPGRNVNEKMFLLQSNLTSIPTCYCGNHLIFGSFVYSQFCSQKCSNSDPTKKHLGETTRRLTIKNTVVDYNQLKIDANSFSVDEWKRMILNRLSTSSGELDFKKIVKWEYNLMLEQFDLPGFNSNAEKIYAILNDLTSIPVCKECSAPVSFKNVSDGYFDFCSLKCSNSNQHTKQKITDQSKITRWENFVGGKLQIYLERFKQNGIICLFNEDEFTNTHTKYKFKHETCGKEFFGYIATGKIPSCPHCRIVGSSQIERKLADDLELIFPQIIRNDRELIKPKEIDIVIDAIGIEVNGVYWHQADIEKTSLLEKSNMSPIQLLHFWDFELNSKYDICLSIIKAKLNHFDQKIFARKCDIHYVGSKEAELFFELNHLQGGGVNSSYYLGLYFNDELVQCISIGNSRFNKNADLEIHRIATKLNTTVVGGINKLWKQVLTDFPNKKIITYADKRISNGELYKRLGFTEQKDSGPNYFYVKGDVRLARYQCQKHKLPKLLGDKFNPELTEKENMILDGYIQIKDCGNKVFAL